MVDSGVKVMGRGLGVGGFVVVSVLVLLVGAGVGFWVGSVVESEVGGVGEDVLVVGDRLGVVGSSVDAGFVGLGDGLEDAAAEDDVRFGVLFAELEGLGERLGVLEERVVGGEVVEQLGVLVSEVEGFSVALSEVADAVPEPGVLVVFRRSVQDLEVGENLGPAVVAGRCSGVSEVVGWVRDARSGEVLTFDCGYLASDVNPETGAVTWFVTRVSVNNLV